jgi:hypothetical protein
MTGNNALRMMGGMTEVDMRDRERRESGVSLGGQAERMMDSFHSGGNGSGSGTGESSVFALRLPEDEVRLVFPLFWWLHC